MGYPLDLIKSRLQTRTVGKRGNVLSITREVLAERGFSGLFRGISAPLSANIPLAAISFTVQTQAQTKLQKIHPNWSSTKRHALAGYLTGLFCVPFAAPFDFLKIQMQTSSLARSLGPFSHGKKIIDHYGLSTLWRGSGIMLVRDPFSFALYFAVYDATKSFARDYFNSQHESHSNFLLKKNSALPSTDDKSKVVAARFPETYFHRIHSTFKRVFYDSERHPTSLSVSTFAVAMEGDCRSGKPVDRKPSETANSSGKGVFKLSTASSELDSNPSPVEPLPPLPQTCSVAAVGSTPASIPLPIQMICGGLAGSSSWFFLHPLDVLKSMQQSLPPGTPNEEVSIISIMKRHRAEGIRFFFRGVGPTFIRAFPSSAVSLPIFDAVRTFLRKYQALPER